MSTREVHAVCTHDCPDSCGVLVTVDELTGRAVKVAGDPAHPVTRGFLCGKVARYLDRVYSPERLLYPMRRKPGLPKGPLAQGHELEAFERISWEEALGEIAARLERISREHGPESILPYSYAGTIGQLGYGSMDRRFFHRLGASQLDRTICASAGTAALNAVYGTRLGTAPQEFVHAGLILVWGANIHGNNVHLWPFIEQARRNGARLIVLDPFRTRTAALADQHLQIRPGTDLLLALSLMHVLFREGLEDRAYMAACTRGAAELREHALRPEHAPERAAQITGLPAEAIRALAIAYGQAGRGGRKPAVLRMNYGIQRAQNGGHAARAVAMLPLITGSWQQRGGGLLLSTSGAFPFNQADLQQKQLMEASPLRRPARTINMNQLGWALTELGTERCLDEFVEGDADSSAPLRKENSPFDDQRTVPSVKALFVYNCNAAAVAPDSNRVLAGLRREDLFTVVHEQFFTDTTDYADIVLPATTFLEHKELMGAYGHYFAQLSDRAIEPLGEARSNVWLFSALARRMGFPEEAFRDTEDELIAQALDSRHPWLEGITPERLAQEKQIPLALPRTEGGETLPFSTPEWFPLGKGQLLPVPTWQPSEESRQNPAKTSRFPLEFLSRKADNYMNTTFANLPHHQTMERRTAGVLEIHAADAAARHLATGDAVEVWNDRGRIELSVRVGASVPQGVVASRLDWHKLSRGGANANALTSQRLTDLGGGATFYSALVEVRKLEAAGN